MIANNAALTREGEDWLTQLLLARSEPRIRRRVHQGQHAAREVRQAAGRVPSAWLNLSAAMGERIGAKQKAMEATRRKRPARQYEPGAGHGGMVIVEAHKGSPELGARRMGTGGQGHARMNIATSRKTLEQALNNLSAALKTL